MDEDRRQQLLNNLIDSAIDRNIDDWRWTGDEWITAIKEHPVSVRGSYIGAPKIGLDGLWLEPDVKKYCTRNVKRLRDLTARLKSKLDADMQAAAEKALIDFEEE